MIISLLSVLGAFVLFLVAFCINSLRLALNALRKNPLNKLVKIIQSKEEYTSLEQIPDIFLRVLICAEDPHFLRHHGFDLWGIYYAAKTNILEHRSKEHMHGGSTITQQLVKNLLLTPKKTFTRKLTELFLSIYVEKKLSKEEILELYCNVIYYGKECYGIRQATEMFFDCLPSELTLNRSLTLICRLPNPDRYDPELAPDDFEKVRNSLRKYLVNSGIILPQTDKQLDVTSWKDAAPQITSEEGAWVLKYSDSPLAKYKKISPNNSGKRTHAIDRITPHCAVWKCNVKTLGKWFSHLTTKASSNYGIGWDGRIAVYVHESDCSWCSSEPDNDQRAVTIECASGTIAPYVMSQEVYDSLILLCEDICRRNGKNKLLWIENRESALKYQPCPDEMLLTVHRWFANKECPGDWLYRRLPELASLVTERLTNNASGVSRKTCRSSLTPYHRENRE